MSLELTSMEAMDYNYFTGSGPQQYQYLDYGADAGLLANGNDGTNNVRSVESGSTECTHTQADGPRTLGPGEHTRCDCLPLWIVRLQLFRCTAGQHRTYTSSDICISTSTTPLDAAEQLSRQRPGHGCRGYAPDETEQ